MTCIKIYHYKQSFVLGSARPADVLNRAKFNLPSSTSGGQSGVLGPEGVVVNSNPKPPGSFPHATRLAAQANRQPHLVASYDMQRGAEDVF